MQLTVSFLFAVCGTAPRVAADYQARRRHQGSFNKESLPFLTNLPSYLSAKFILYYYAGADEVIQCNVKEIHGMVLPGQVEVPAKYICHDVEEPGYTYRLSGGVGSFFEGEDMASGNVQINVPHSAINSDGNISIDDRTASPITISYDRRRLSSVSTTGTKKVLVVRVSDDDDWSNGERKVEQDELQMYSDVFGGGNTLVR